MSVVERIALPLKHLADGFHADRVPELAHPGGDRTQGETVVAQRQDFSDRGLLALVRDQLVAGADVVAELPMPALMAARRGAERAWRP